MGILDTTNGRDNGRRPPAPPRTKRRSCRLLALPTEERPVGLLEITVEGEGPTCYLLEREPNEFGFAAFVVTKLALREVEDSPGQLTQRAGPEYHVLLDRAASLCECIGFQHRGMGRDGKGCRHVAALTCLVSRGLL